MAGKRRRKVNPIKKLFRKGGGFYDYSLLFIVLFLVGFGLIMIYSTSYYSASIYKGDPMYYLKRQGGMAMVGIIAMLFISKFDYGIIRRRAGSMVFMNVSFWILCFSILLQIYVLINGVEINYAKRWISLGPLGTMQPSDFAKIAVVLYVAAFIHEKPRLLDHWIGFFIIAALPVIDIALIAVENMSTAIVLCIIVGGMCYIASRKRLYFYVIAAIGAIGGVGYIFLSGDFRLARLNAMKDLQSSGDQGYQTLQGLYAIASGGVFGKGLGQSMQKLGFVPEAQNDMIFSIICEELGLFGACCVLFLFIMMLWRIFQIAVNSKELFGGMICVGIMLHIAAQVLLNVAVVTNTIPNTGVALPFISYGGTSVAMILMEVGLVLSVANQIKAE